MANSKILSLIHYDVGFALTELQNQLKNNQLELLLILFYFVTVHY